MVVRPVAQGMDLFESAEEVGLRDDEGAKVSRITGECIGVEDPRVAVVVYFLQHDALVLYHGFDDATIFRVYGARHEDASGLGFAVGAHGHEDGLGECRGTVVQGGVGGVHGGEPRHHGLVFVEELQDALAGLGLVGCVGGIELAPRGDLPHCGGDVVFVGPGPDEA